LEDDVGGRGQGELPRKRLSWNHLTPRGYGNIRTGRRKLISFGPLKNENQVFERDFSISFLVLGFCDYDLSYLASYLDQ